MEVYRESADELASSRRALELRLSEYGAGALRSFEEVRELFSVASSVRVDFASTEGTARRKTIETALCNHTVREGHIASNSTKTPSEPSKLTPPRPFWVNGGRCRI